MDAIVAMGLRFQDSTTYAKHLRATADTLRSLAERLVQHEHADIWIAERDRIVVGMLAAMVYTQPMSGELIGTEICWWMDPSVRGGRGAIRLLRAAEGWARSRGAVAFQMMAPTQEVGRFYEVLAYEPIETHYMRRLS